jgi:hypothetical protein
MSYDPTEGLRPRGGACEFLVIENLANTLRILARFLIISA